MSFNEKAKKENKKRTVYLKVNSEQSKEEVLQLENRMNLEFLIVSKSTKKIDEKFQVSLK